MQRSLAIRFLLVFALLFVQLGGAMHGIAHTLAEQQQEQTLPHDKQCDLCASYAQLGSALGNNALPHFTTTRIGEPFTATTLTAYHTPSFAAFAARAPPYSV
ncbi:MAG: hypothetical protein PHY62_01990 [Gallionella sp.]|nr:hypothetical protein [Gallionella sp.]